MDAIGAHAPEPDDRYMFDSIVANLDIDEAGIEQDATATREPEPAPAPAVPKTPATPPPAPKADQEQAAAPIPAPTPLRAPVAVPAAVLEPLPQPVKPQRPALVEPVEPDPPKLGRAETTGHIASVTGYVMSVGVGAFGQIMFLGGWLEAMLPSPGNWIAALIGAAFAEIGMIGAGNSSLSKRKDGGRWKLLFAVACFVCAGAVTMQVAHWLPKGFGVALVFGLASFVGFLIHMTIEHSKIRDYEDRVAKYKAELTAYRAEQQARYEQDLAAYEAAVAEQQRQRRQVEQAAKKAVASSPSPAPAQPAPASTDSAKPASKTGGRAAAKKPGKPELDRATALDWVRTSAPDAGPAAVRQHFTAKGFEVPTDRTLRRWLNDNEDATK